MYFDSHAHLTCSEVFPHVEQMLESAKKSGFLSIANICTDKDSLEKGIQLAKDYPGYIINVGATTPHDVEKEGNELFPIFEAAARRGDLSAIGETGLDYYYTISNKEIQKEFLRRYLRLAKELKLPVVIHCRDAFEDFFEILDQEFRDGDGWLPGVLHCFTGTLDEAKEVVKRGWYLSLSGIVTYKKSDVLKEVARWVPENQLLIETDTPYLAPQKYRGKLNQPSYMIETATLIAELKGRDVSEISRITAENAISFFNLNPNPK